MMTGKRKFFRRQLPRAAEAAWTPQATRDAIIHWAKDHNIDPAVLGSAVWSLGIDLAKAANVSLEQVTALLKDAWDKKDN